MANKNIHAKRVAPGGLDFVPVPGGPDQLVFGVSRRQIGVGPIQTVGQSILRRLCPGTTVAIDEPWQPSCYRWDVLLPPNAPDECRDPKRLCDLYEAQACAGLKDLAVMATLRFPYPGPLHQVWEDVRAFAFERLCIRNLAVVLAMHLPVLVGSTNPPHVHLMMPARELRSFGFSEFVRPLATDQGKQILADELAEWMPQFAA